MNNEELKKKIVEVLKPVIRAGNISCNEENACKRCWFPCEIERTAGRLADALIAAGIVDKSDYASMKETAVRYKAEVSKAGARVKEAEAEANRYEMLYKLQNRDMALAERRAHDAEHRAEVAERALRIFAENCSCADCPFFGGCQIIPDVEDDFSCCFDMYLAIAEKDLMDERK